MNSTVELCKQLIARASVSPDDAGCQELLTEKLSALGFTIEQMPFGAVSNFWARKGNSGPVLCFAGHTDVVPAGDPDSWDSNPFHATERDGYLYGRGAADMKGSLAAMISACEDFLGQYPEHQGSIAFLITSDEESVAIDGTRRVIETLQQRGEKIDFCIVGEPSSTRTLGDVVKNGRRGSLNGILTVKGQLGHVAYPDLASNPIHHMLPALSELCRIEWDQGNEYFPATSFQISNIRAGTGANNVIPATMEVLFNFRFSSEVTAATLRSRTEEVLNAYHRDYDLTWQLSGDPFLTPAGSLTRAVSSAVKTVTGTDTALSTGGGTSDGRFIASTGAEVVELGPVNATIHKVNECVRIEDLGRLAQIYREILIVLLPESV